MISLAGQVAVVTGGSRALLPPHSWHVRPGTIELLVDTPVETQGLDKRDAEELSARVRARICENFA